MYWRWDVRGPLRLETGRLSAINHDGMTDRESCNIRTQPENRIRDLFRPTKATNRFLGDHPLAVLLGPLCESANHRCIDDARTHSVDSDAVLPILKGS